MRCRCNYRLQEMLCPSVIIEHRRHSAAIQGPASMRFKGFLEFGPSPGSIERFELSISRLSIAERRQSDQQKAHRPDTSHMRKFTSALLYGCNRSMGRILMGPE